MDFCQKGGWHGLELVRPPAGAETVSIRHTWTCFSNKNMTSLDHVSSFLWFQIGPSTWPYIKQILHTNMIKSNFMECTVARSAKYLWIIWDSLSYRTPIDVSGFVVWRFFSLESHSFVCVCPGISLVRNEKRNETKKHPHKTLHIVNVMIRVTATHGSFSFMQYWIFH